MPSKPLAPASGERGKGVRTPARHTCPTLGFLPKTVTYLLPLFVSKQLLSGSQR